MLFKGLIKISNSKTTHVINVDLKSCRFEPSSAFERK